MSKFQKEDEHKPNFTEPMRMSMLHPEQCEDCAFRDKTTITIDGKEIEVGSTKGCCVIYPYPEIKPDEVMENTGECEWYEKDD